MTINGPSLISSFFGAKNPSVNVGQEHYGDSPLARDLKTLTTRRETSNRTILEGGSERHETETTETTLTDQREINRASSFDINGDPSSLLLLSLGVPRVTMKLPNGKGTVPVGGGSCARIGKGIFVGANHVNAMGIGSRDRNPISGSDVLKDIHELTKQGAEIWIDFPVPVAPTVFSQSNGASGSEIKIVSVQAVILGEDPINDLAILGLKDPTADIQFPGIPNNQMPLVRMGAEYPNVGDIVVKVGHAGCTDPTLVSVGEVIVSELTPEQIDKIAEQLKRLKHSLLNVFGELRTESGPGAILQAITQGPHIQLKTFQGKVVTNALAEPGDSGGVLIKTKTREYAGTTVLTLNSFLNNRLAAGIITGYLLGVQPQHIPVDHLSAYTGVRPTLELLDRTLGRQNLYRILDGNGEEVVVSQKEATINQGRHAAVFALRGAIKAELETDSATVTPLAVDAELQTRHQITPDAPLDSNALRDRVAQSRTTSFAEKLPIKSSDDQSPQTPKVCKLGDYTFKNEPTGIVSFECTPTKEKDAITVKITFTTSGDNESAEITAHPSVLTKDTSDLIDSHTKSIIQGYLEANVGKGIVFLAAIKQVLDKTPAPPEEPGKTVITDKHTSVA